VALAAAAADSTPSRLRRRMLSFGDQIMMRRQLLNLRKLAEAAAGHS